MNEARVVLNWSIRQNPPRGKEPKQGTVKGPTWQLGEWREGSCCQPMAGLVMGVVLHGREMLAFNGQQHRKTLGYGVAGQG